ncbi:hypothetical protein LIER_29475 [Lithospermum erythrorhizon]|uniref:Glutaredoxin domain-containing protein n=1 Tax=Lithospermum erythrorhizon TaxID=34254 RepID=A0AAV3RJB8_LITER
MDSIASMASKNAVVIFSKSSCCMSHAIKRLFYDLGVWLYDIIYRNLVLRAEKVCDGSGEDATCSRPVSGTSMSDHLVYYGVEMGCDTDSSCKMVMDPRVAAYASQDQLGNFILTRNLSSLALKTNGEPDHLADSS